MKRDEIDDSESEEVQQEADEVDGEMVFEFEVLVSPKSTVLIFKYFSLSSSEISIYLAIP